MSILDCTLRDGGYINNWRFTDKFVQNYLELMNKSNVEYVELGFLNKKETYKGKIIGKYRCLTNEDISSLVGDDYNFKIAVMVDLKNIDFSKITPANESKIDLFRVAFHKKDRKKALDTLLRLKELGYAVSANAMATINYAEKELVDLVHDLDRIETDYVYIADSYGFMFPHQMMGMIDIIRSVSNIKIGVHLHNNLQNGFLNFYSTVGVDIDIVDGTLYGMGRGAGNLPTELILVYKDIDVYEQKNIIREIIYLINDFLKDIFDSKTNKWGYDLDYMYGAYLQCHPNYVSKMRDMEVKTKDIIKLLDIVRETNQNRYFSLDVLEQIVLDYF